ncbi:50S ribosome-binding GTPase, partial [Rhizoctonia solani]
MVDTGVGTSGGNSSTPIETGNHNYPSQDPPPRPTKPTRELPLHETERPATKETRTRVAQKDPIRVLVLGRSGSGKTHTIQTLCHSGTRPMDIRLYNPTKKPYSKSVLMDGLTFELIDTPGFDNIDMSDAEVFTEIADYLLEPHRIKLGITGIIYVHRTGDTTQSRSLSRNLKVLTDVLLQEVGTRRLMVLELQLGAQKTSHAALADEIRSPRSVFNRVWALGADISHNSDRRGFLELLESYVSQTPIMLPIQSGNSRDSCSAFTARVERILGYYEQESMKSLLRNQERELQEIYQANLARQRESELQLRMRLKESELEYSSLRSQLQLQENMEQSEIVQSLDDLNRMIDDVGRSISAYLTDTYVSTALSKDPSSATSLDSVDLPKLKELLEHSDGKPSLVMSLDGRGMQIESFFDFSIRLIICRHLLTSIFRPFHPAIRSNLSRVLHETSENIRKQAPQAIAGKWRSETFKNLYGNQQGKREEHIDARMDMLVNDQFKTLVGSVLGLSVSFTKDHISRLRHLIETAWDWNSKLKGEVIMLGDFIQTGFRPRARFNPELMEEFEASPRSPRPRYVLGTLALGLSSQRALGGGNPVEETTVCKAVVLTNNAFA